MRGPRFRIAGLMGVVVLVGVAVAAFRDGSEWWVTLLFSLAAAALLVSVLGVIFGRGKKRAFWTGFALGGFGYLLLAYVLGTHDLLITTKIVRSIEENWQGYGRNPYGVRWNGMYWRSRDAVAHLLAIWPVAIFGGSIASYFHGRGEGSDQTGRVAPSE